MGPRRAPRASGEDQVFLPTRHASGVGDSEAPAGGEGAAGRQALGTCLPPGTGRCSRDFWVRGRRGPGLHSWVVC